MKKLLKGVIGISAMGLLTASCSNNALETDAERMKDFNFAVFEDKTMDIVIQNDLGEFVKAPVLITDGPAILGYGVTNDQGELHAPISWHAGMDLQVHIGNNHKVDVGDLGHPVALTYNPPKTATHKTETIIDSDGDGVTDSLDIDPQDARFVSYSSASGRFMFEDIYPFQGDYDFNDVVVDYQIDGYLDNNGDVRKVMYFFTPRNSGAGNPNKLGFQLANLSNEDLTTINDSTSFDEAITKVANAAKWELSPNFSLLNNGAVGTYSSTFTWESYPIVKTVYPNYGKSTGTYWKSYYYRWEPSSVAEIQTSSFSNSTYTQWSTVDTIAEVMDNGAMIVSFDLPAGYSMSDVSGNNLDAFITIVTGDGIHTKPLNQSFADETGMPFGLHVPQEVMWPAENERIDSVYAKFNAWATSNGTTNQIWWE